jgi:uncharacterized oxidoreductase
MPCGNRVIVAGRRQDALQAVAKGRDGMSSMTLDISNAEDIERFAAEVVERHQELNILVNNAGIMRMEELDRRRDLRDAEETVATNLLGPIRLTNALVEHLAGQEGAAIVNVTSGLAFVPLVTTPTYNATKAAIHSYTLSLRAALKGRVEVIELAPPAVQTELTPGQSSRAGYQPLDSFADEVMDLWDQQPTPPELLVEAVKHLRFAEREGRFDETFDELTARIEAARAAQG